MQLVALVQSPDHVCYRYRVAAFADALRRRDIVLQAEVLARGLLARLRQFARLRRAEGVLLQRRLLPVGQLAFLRRTARRLIFDVDDALWQRDSFHRKGARSSQRLFRYWATVTVADRVIVGNRYLRHRTADYTDPEKVSLIPTCVDPSLYRLAAHQRAGSSIRLVWIGQRSTLPSLRCAEEQLARVAVRLPGLRLRVISDHFPSLRSIRVETCRWSQQSETARLAESDVGISWLPNDQWSLGKCGLKVLQYMAAGLPVVANRVGIHNELIHHGVTGFLADTPQQWEKAVVTLACDPCLRATMGKAARRLVERRYSVAAWKDIFARLVEQTLADRQATEDRLAVVLAR